MVKKSPTRPVHTIPDELYQKRRTRLRVGLTLAASGENGVYGFVLEHGLAV